MHRASSVIAVALVTCVLASLAAPGSAAAQEDQQGRYGGSPWGIGFQSSWPAYGISGIYDVNEAITAQAVLGAFGVWTTLSGRLQYHFQRQPAYSLFGVGAVGIWRYNFRAGRINQTSPMVGGGAGVELNWQEILSSNGDSTFPPLFSNIDITLTFASFDHYSWNALSFGAGLHYRF